MTSNTDTTKVLNLYKAFYQEHGCFPTYADLARATGEYPSLIMRRLVALAAGEDAPLVDWGQNKTYRYRPSAATLEEW